MMMSSSGISCKFPFTASQWQELEHQALVFKYMVSGIPIPPDLLFSIRRSFDSKFLLHQTPQHMGWNGFQMGYGRKIDPEPGRCRRTDGKKWRCSKDAYPDSKYCERHMHRGRNRSRKPVETTSSSSSVMNPMNNNINVNSSISKNTSESHFVYPHFSSSKPHENTSSKFSLESNAHSRAPAKDYRNIYGQGTKGETNEHAFFSETDSNSSWKVAPLAMGSPLSQMKQQQFQNYYTNCDDHYNNNMPLNNIERDIDQQPKKVMHHFLDEWPLKNEDTEDQMSSHRTQLCISTPTSMHDFFITPK